MRSALDVPNRSLDSNFLILPFTVLLILDGMDGEILNLSIDMSRYLSYMDAGHDFEITLNCVISD